MKSVACHLGLATALAVVVVSARPALADETWVGKTVLTARDGLKSRAGATPVADLAEIQYRVLREQDHWILVKNYAGIAGWIDKKDVVPAEEAVDYFAERIRQDPNDAVAYNRRALARQLKGELDPAIADYTQSLRLKPDEVSVYNNRGNAWNAKKNYDQAIEDYSAALRLDPRNMVTWVNRGSTWNAKKNYDKAIDDLNEAIRLAPTYASLYNTRGQVRINKKDYDKALADFTVALRLDPKLGPAYTGRSIVWRTQREHDRALADANEGIRLDPKNWVTYFQRGNTYRGMKSYEKAIGDYNEALRLDPTAAGVLAARGLTRFLNKDYDRAIQDFDQCERLDPRTGWLYRNRALMLATCPDANYRNGAKALAELKKAQELLPPAADVDEAAAAVNAENGNFAEAVRWQERALEDLSYRINPDMQFRLGLYQSHQPYREGAAEKWWAEERAKHDAHAKKSGK